MTAILLSHGLLKREQKTSTILKQRKLLDLWDKYGDTEMSSLELLNECVSLLKSNFPLINSVCESLDDSDDDDDY
jgi:hypothetical protein